MTPRIRSFNRSRSYFAAMFPCLSTGERRALLKTCAMISMYLSMQVLTSISRQPSIIAMSLAKCLSASIYQVFKINSRASAGATHHVKVSAWQWVTHARQDLIQYEQGRQPAHASAVKTDQAEVLLVVGRRLRHGHGFFSLCAPKSLRRWRFAKMCFKKKRGGEEGG